MNVAWTVVARNADAIAACERAEAWAIGAGCAAGVGLKLALVLEELLTNTIKYGNGKDSEATVRLVLEIADGRLRVTYEDDAPAFDPLQQIAATTPGSANVGGFGLHLIRGLVETMTYARQSERNVVGLVMAANPLE